MEYVQTVLFQVEAARLEQASQPGGLFAELDEHRAYLRQQPGFRDLRITRSINPEGNVLVVVETRWTDDESLVRYETGEPNAAGIIREHRSVIVPDSLQVLDMEAIRTEQFWRPIEAEGEARARIILPVAVPLAALAFMLLVIYGLSRIYLELENSEVATGLAAGIALAILGTAFYLANNPRVPGWQIAGIFVVATAALATGAIYAVSDEDATEAEGPEEPTASPGGETPPAGVAGTILMDDFFFEFDGQQNPTIQVPAGQEVTYALENVGNAPHNMHVGTADGEYLEGFCEPGGEDPACSEPNQMNGGDTGTIKITLEPGTYPYQCDFHPQQMLGTIEAQ